MSKQINAIKGMNDILPPESARWEWLEEVVRRVMAAHAYRNIRTPIMEHTQLFTRGLGEVTDVVEKEMYSFQDRADQHGHAEHLSLRPESTAGVVRAVAEHNLLYDGGKLEGELSIKGISRPRSLEVAPATCPRPAVGCDVVATGAVRRSDYDMDDWMLAVSDRVVFVLRARIRSARTPRPVAVP